ncbi:dihydrofolate reductase family protein [Nocardiopsis ansamitocini]|nr:dihydrofolate reductase family protein [Nocardiopsis ansamitocini]
MRTLTYYVAVTLDGYIAAPDGSYDFFPWSQDLTDHISTRLPETVPTHIRAQLGMGEVPNQRFDTVVMGRGTYQPALDAGITSPYAHMRQYVASTTLKAIDDPAVELVQRDPLALVRTLKKEEGELGIWLAGGGVLAGVLAPEVDELVIKRYPIVIGAGLPAFDGEFAVLPFRLEDTLTFANGTTLSVYTRA